MEYKHKIINIYTYKYLIIIYNNVSYKNRVLFETSYTLNIKKHNNYLY